jgi:NADH:ubiquinone oxidoreductase subunit F (NADH-binding)/(2Fe-2S) ferredoxin/NAD-dependent dihydropyrimidine dehydrogenase PreA subunit
MSDAKIRKPDDLEKLRVEGLRLISPDNNKITVGMATCGIAQGAKEVFDAINDEVSGQKADITIARTGCIGYCQAEPIVEVYLPGRARILYHRMSPKKTKELVSLTAKGEIRKEWSLCTTEGSIDTVPPMAELPFYKKQERNVTRNCGVIDPRSIAEYIARGGYLALAKALRMKPEEVINEISGSGLRGRGGGGFPTGRKWTFARNAKADQKYIICNGDEGDPGAYMDRGMMEGDPFAILEGMTIAAYAVGASYGYWYTRDEYPLAIEMVMNAIDSATRYGLLGKDILGSGFGFDVRMARGAGAFVCGEETALIASVEGRLPNPSPRPPYPAISGLFGKPTVINNVETLANIPQITRHGAEWFSSRGTESTKGTKIFSLVGKIKNNGLVEVPMGISLREMVFDIGGGIPGGRRFKAVQSGGPSGGLIPEELLDTPVDYESLEALGAIMGSGGMIVTDEKTCMVDLTKFFFDFLKYESCGKCAPCREGIRQALEILERISSGQGKDEDIETLDDLAHMIKDFSLCALGGTAPNSLLTTLKYFRDEYMAHVEDKRCPAGVCKSLITYQIDPEKCNGCHACARSCPQGAIVGVIKEVHSIDEQGCIKCGSCLEACKFDAVIVE